jgi:hypothetical protein
MKKYVLFVIVLCCSFSAFADFDAKQKTGEDFKYIWGSDYSLKTLSHYIFANYYFFYMDADSELCLHKETSETADRFFFENAGDNWYYLVNADNNKHLQCNQNGKENAIITLAEKSGNNNQKWRLIPSAEANYYYIVSFNNSHVLAGQDGKTTNNQKLALRNFTGYKGQLWRIEPAKEL